MRKDKKEGSKKSILGMFGVSSNKQQPKAKTVDREQAQEDKIKLVKNHATAHPSKIQGDGVYKAFSFSKAAQPMLELRYKGGNGIFLQYHLMTPSDYVKEESITIFCQETAYILKGKNLRPLFNHYRQNNIEYIQEFDPAMFTHLPAEEDPLIMEIEVFEI